MQIAIVIEEILVGLGCLLQEWIVTKMRSAPSWSCSDQVMLSAML